MRNRLRRHGARPNLIWIAGVVAGLLVGGIAAYELASIAVRHVA